MSSHFDLLNGDDERKRIPVKISREKVRRLMKQFSRGLQHRRQAMIFEKDFPAFMEESFACSDLSGVRAGRTGTSAAPSAELEFSKAQKRIAELTQKPSGSSARPKSSTVKSLAPSAL